ncbi:unnamed protein product [Mytilus coruscus]|uniref:LITAF domain-containing protein n=1 Tax=Mytilus coruscus TaxID=42192 RepID=A0A6J8CCY8_MYTCO|nr:unnamed protein product [Mytilus coruscus]
MNTPQQIQDSSPIFYSQLPPPAIYIQPPQLCPNYGQPPSPQIHNRPPFSNGQATFKHDPDIIDGALGVVKLNDPNNPANSEKPVKMKCPSCEENITTVTKYVTSCDTYILAIVLVLNATQYAVDSTDIIKVTEYMLPDVEDDYEAELDVQDDESYT